MRRVDVHEQQAVRIVRRQRLRSDLRDRHAFRQLATLALAALNPLADGSPRSAPCRARRAVRSRAPIAESPGRRRSFLDEGASSARFRNGMSQRHQHVRSCGASSDARVDAAERAGVWRSSDRHADASSASRPDRRDEDRFRHRAEHRELAIDDARVRRRARLVGAAQPLARPPARMAGRQLHQTCRHAR